MAAMALLFSVLSLLFTSVLANTEKTIFLGPEPVPLAFAQSTLQNNRLDVLTPSNGTLRTKLTAQFPTEEHPEGIATWLILDKLTPGQRYEVRVCWPATQPTEFSLSTFTLSEMWNTPELVASMSDYSHSRRHIAPRGPRLSTGGSGKKNEISILLLRITAAADYFTTNTTLMRDVPPVDVDIILDPFLLNVLPRSIAGTACYILIVAVVSYLLAGRIVFWIQGLIACGATSSGEARIKKRQ